MSIQIMKIARHKLHKDEQTNEIKQQTIVQTKCALMPPSCCRPLSFHFALMHHHTLYICLAGTVFSSLHLFNSIEICFSSIIIQFQFQYYE